MALSAVHPIALGTAMHSVDSVRTVSHDPQGTFQLQTKHTMTPSDTAWQQLISALHASGRKAALAITGGGSGAIGELLRVPGGSRLLIEAQVPYDPQALTAFLGFAPAQASSSDTAIAMARSARARAARLMPAGTDLVGLGATAALVSDRPRKGEHRFHVAFVDSACTAHCTGVMAKGRRDRGAEEDLVSRAIVLFLAHACGIAAPSPRSLLDADEHFAETVAATVDPIDQLLAGEVDRVTVQPDGQMMLSAPRPLVLLPGSFNPLHEGHVLLARVAEELRQQPVAFEISVTNVDKPPLSGTTVRHRLAQFAWKSPVELTRAPTFVEKSRLFPGTTFVIGADTAERLFAPKYYGDDELRMHVALEEIANSGCSFLVAVRIDAAGRVRALNDVRVPRRYADLFTEIPAQRFRFDTSSSEIRARGRAAGNS
jgi:nicotinic acid mononucleotide adenylyltransferase